MQICPSKSKAPVSLSLHRVRGERNPDLALSEQGVLGRNESALGLVQSRRKLALCFCLFFCFFKKTDAGSLRLCSGILSGPWGSVGLLFVNHSPVVWAKLTKMYLWLCCDALTFGMSTVAVVPVLSGNHRPLMSSLCSSGCAAALHPAFSIISGVC